MTLFKNELMHYLQAIDS